MEACANQGCPPTGRPPCGGHFWLGRILTRSVDPTGNRIGTVGMQALDVFLEQCRSARPPDDGAVIRQQMAEVVVGCFRLVSVYGRPLGEPHVLLDDPVLECLAFFGEIDAHLIQLASVCLVGKQVTLAVNLRKCLLG